MLLSLVRRVACTLIPAEPAHKTPNKLMGFSRKLLQKLFLQKSLKSPKSWEERDLGMEHGIYIICANCANE